MKRLTPAVVSLMMIFVVGLLVAAYCAKKLLGNDRRSPRAGATAAAAARPVEYQSVPIAQASIEPGTELTPVHLGTGRVRSDTLEPEVLRQEKSLVGRTAKESIRAGEPIRASQLYPPGERPSLSVGTGMRAMSVSFPRGAGAVSDLIRAGQSVDVHFTFQPGATQNARLRGGLALTLLSGVRVLAITHGKDAGDSTAFVTLELTPEQANILILAREKGALALCYNPDGQRSTGIALQSPNRATFDEILGLNPDAKVALSSTRFSSSSAGRRFTSDVYKGASRTTLEFPSTD